ncbi:MAG: PilZ domain-containing protein [Sphingomicrobium sp.]
MTEAQRPQRVPLSCEVSFRRHGDAAYRVDLIDFSREGCCISPPIRLEPGASIWLRIPDIEATHGVVVWVREWRVGVKFDHPFHPAVFDLIVEKLSKPSAP